MGETPTRRRDTQGPSQYREVGNTECHGQPLVELLAIHADLRVVGTTITVFDTKQGQIIYKHQDQGIQMEERDEQGVEKSKKKQEMPQLELTGPYTGIEAYRGFAIEIDIPGDTADSSIGDSRDPITWEWDSHKYATQVDALDEPSVDFVCTPDKHKIAKVTYAVMSNALEAAVQVMLRLKNGEDVVYGVHGTIRAFIGKFNVGSVLFSREQAMGQPFFPRRSRFLQLARSVVAVPCGFPLRLEVNLHIGNSSKKIETQFILDNGIPSQSYEQDGNQIEVNVSWYPEYTTAGSVPLPIRQKKTLQIKLTRRQPDLSYVVGDDGERFSEFIRELRCKVADHPSRVDVSDHPVLANELRWLHVKLQVVTGENEMCSTTLVMRDDNLCVMGFMNKKGVWFELGEQKTTRDNRMLPRQYNSKLLDWGNSYRSILSVRNHEEVVKILAGTGLDKNFVVRAVRLLSCFPEVGHVAGDMSPSRLALAGVIVMVCESAKLNPVCHAIAHGWNTGTVFTMQLMNYILKWGLMSSALLRWKDHMYYTWIGYPELDRIGIQSPREALDVIHLVRNFRIHGRPENYMLGESLSFAYPEMLQISFPEMLRKMSIATVQVNLQRPKEGHMNSVYGKIAALVSDKPRHSVCFRVGSMLFARTEGMVYQPRYNDSKAPLPLLRSLVAVPLGMVLHIEVDLHIKISHNDQEMIKHLKNDFVFDKIILCQSPEDTSGEVEVEITKVDEKEKENFPPQLSHPVEVLETLSGHPVVVYTIGDVMSYTEFIMALRRILAHHPDREDILDAHDLLNLSSSRRHPLLAKRRAGQPARWLHVKLKVDGEETSSTTLVMRDDNMSILGFVNQDGVLYKLVDINKNSKDMISEEYRRPTEDLNWSLSYKSLLEVKTEELMNAKLGSGFAMDAVCVLSRYPNLVAGYNNMKARVALAGLMVMVCDSARLNPVLDIIADGWNTGMGFTKQLMDCIRNWGQMSTSLRRWKRGNYAEQNCYSELRDVYLVLNDQRICSSKSDDGKKVPRFSKAEMAIAGQSHQPEQSTSKETGEQESQAPSPSPQDEYDMDHLLSFAYPEMLKARFPEMFKKMSVATVHVNLRRLKRGHMNSVYGKISALISDKERKHSVDFRAGSMLFTRTQGDELTCSNSSVIEVPLARSVAVPSGWVLHIKVDMYVKIPHNNTVLIKHLNDTFHFDEGKLSESKCPKGTSVQVEVNITWANEKKDKQDFPPQLSRPVEVFKTISGHPTVVYTIGDVMSYTEFIMALRRILADHPDRDDILDGHELLNTSSTGEHPLLPKVLPDPASLLDVKLQVVVEGKETSSTTLVMRGDNLYVLGFMNQDGVLYKLLNDKTSKSVIPEEYHHSCKEVYWGVLYKDILEVKVKGTQAIHDKIAKKLADKKLHSAFAMDAVRVLSRYPDKAAGTTLKARVALAGLIVMVCESARMNTVQDAIAGGWNKGSGVTEKLLANYLFEYGEMSQRLLAWKKRNYAEPHCYTELRATHLVLNDSNAECGGGSGDPAGRAEEAGDAGKAAAVAAVLV